MKIKKWVRVVLQLKDERGAIAIIVGLSMVMFMGFTALAVDIGYLMITRNQLQNIADSSALAATRQLGVLYEEMTTEEQQDYVCDPAVLIVVALDTAALNSAGGLSNIVINPSDVVIGQWNGSTKILTPTLNQPDAVRVTARRDGNANGPITTFFAKMLGKDTFNVSALATAALTAQSTAGPGTLPVPVGISKKWFDPGFCDQPIKMYPTNDPEGCAGWHTFDNSPANAHTLSEMLTALANGTYESPEVIAGETQLEFTGGNLASVLDHMKALFDAMKVLNDGVLDQDLDSDTWTTSVVVYESDDCSNPTGTIPIIGFSTITIEEVTEPPDMTIWASVSCNQISEGRGGGGEYGTKGSIPGLVE